MTTATDDHAALAELEARIKALLPDEYKDSYEDVRPVSMGSAALKFGADGKVAWNEMWATFCDLAMAGGPPHKGTLLLPAEAIESDADRDRYRLVVDEIIRGIGLVTGLSAQATSTVGWIRVPCPTETMASWLLRAIVMENVSARAFGRILEVPAAPHYRVEKEIKNVVTVMAKTTHYWSGHATASQQRAIGQLFMAMHHEAPLVEPGTIAGGLSPDLHRLVVTQMSDTLTRETSLAAAPEASVGWFGVVCPSVRMAIWIMRAMVASNILARREGTTLFVPVNPLLDPGGERVVHAIARASRWARARGVY